MLQRHILNNIYVWILLSIIGLEVLVRIIGPSLSGNIRHISDIPEITDGIREDNSAKRRATLFLGNSLIANAVDLDLYQSEVLSGGNDITSTHMIVPDGTSTWDWYCIAKNNLIDPPFRPDTVIIGFAWGTEPPAPSRLSGYFCSLADLPDLYRLGMTRSSDLLEYLVASLSRIYVMRETIRKRILDVVIPHYRSGTRTVNAAQNGSGTTNPVSTIPDHGTHITGELARLLSAHEIKPVVVAMPVVDNYRIDDEISQEVINQGGHFFDYRHLEGMDDSKFRDPIHLNEKGRLLFTRKIAADTRTGSE